MLLFYTNIEGGRFKPYNTGLTKEEVLVQLNLNRDTDEETGITWSKLYEEHSPEIIHSVLFEDGDRWDAKNGIGKHCLVDGYKFLKAKMN